LTSYPGKYYLYDGPSVEQLSDEEMMKNFSANLLETLWLVIIVMFAMPGVFVGFVVRAFREGYNMGYGGLSDYLEEEYSENEMEPEPQKRA
jgi:hypothetical protein